MTFEKTISNKFGFESSHYMKKYKLYKKVKPVYFNFEELLANIILPLVIVSYAAYPILYFFGTKSAIIFNVLLALIANYFHKGLKKYFQILSNNYLGLSVNFFRFCSLVIIFIILLIVDFGFYLLVVYQKNNEFNIFHFYSWLLLLFGLPLLYYILKIGQYYYVKKHQEFEFLNILLAVNHDLDLFLAINNIQFINTVSKKSSDIKITNNIRSYTQKEFMATKTKTRNYYANKEGFREQVQIPFNTNSLLLSWFSYVENKYYSIQISFPFDKFIIQQKKHSTDRFKICSIREREPLYLHFYLNGGIKFFYKDEIIIDCPFNNESRISEEDKKRFFFH